VWGGHLVSVRGVHGEPSSLQADGQKAAMRWSPTGAQLFLQVRTQVLNNDLATHFQRWYPDFTHHSGPVKLAT
jgi:hypothetical protein